MKKKLKQKSHFETKLLFFFVSKRTIGNRFFLEFLLGKFPSPSSVKTSLDTSLARWGDSGVVKPSPAPLGKGWRS